MTMLVYAEHNTQRLRYVLNFIFGEVLETDYRITGNAEEFRHEKGPKINYSADAGAGGFAVPVSGLLQESGIREVEVGLKTGEGSPVLFHRDHLSVGGSQEGLDYDLFSAVFYMIARYEEYLPFRADRHGRFEAAVSLAGQQGFLELPVVDFWIKEFQARLTDRFGKIPLAAGRFRFLPTCDVDLPYAYLHRGRIRTLGARLRSGENGGLRREVLSGNAPDPFDTFEEMEAIHARHRLRPTIFFLTARYGKFDRSISPDSRAFRSLVRQSGKFADLGIHPSYRASGNLRLLKKEAGSLARITGEPVTRSRQHYLKFRLPDSYRDYLEAGIREEYSMGFASAAGFRAGTSRPFFFYDLGMEEETRLRVFPFQVMDRTLKDYMGLTPEQGLEKILKIASAVRTVGGTFTSIWHNDTFSDSGEWIGWKDVYLQMTHKLSS